jgi:hypothetical protein
VSFCGGLSMGQLPSQTQQPCTHSDLLRVSLPFGVMLALTMFWKFVASTTLASTRYACLTVDHRAWNWLRIPRCDGFQNVVRRVLSRVNSGLLSKPPLESASDSLRRVVYTQYPSAFGEPFYFRSRIQRSAHDRYRHIENCVGMQGGIPR